MLLGRSGRFATQPPTTMLDGHVPLMALRCDAAVAEESCAALASYSASTAGSLVAIMHAGGILQDAMLPQQTLSTVRATSAPKLCFMVHATLPAQLQAVQAVNLFSSVAAFIGSPGQANYAAANIALDCWSMALQKRGTAGEQAKFCFIQLGCANKGLQRFLHFVLIALLCSTEWQMQAAASNGVLGLVWAWHTGVQLCWPG